jgi:cytochrome P450
MVRGGGAHYCLGAHLARREIRTLLEQVLARFDDVAPTGETAWMVGGPDQSVAVSLDRMPVQLTPR